MALCGVFVPKISSVERPSQILIKVTVGVRSFLLLVTNRNSTLLKINL